MNLKSKKQKYIVIALSVLVALSIIFIFSNSLKNGERSNAESSKIIELVKPILDAIFGENVLNVRYVVRKSAHFAEFALLGCLTLTLVRALTEYTGKKLLFAGLFGTLSVAVIDEYIQSFTGRTSLVGDVVLDFSGALFGMLATYLFYLVIRKAKK